MPRPGPLFPVYLKTADGAEPADPICYIVAANGIFIARNSALFASVTPVQGVTGLREQPLALSLSIPRIPRVLLDRLLGFFRWVYDRWEGEAIALIYYCAERRAFRLVVPPQRLTRVRFRNRWHTQGRVEYRSLQRPQGFIKLGDAHSHAGGPAFFSDTDDRDDREDGLRVVMGHIGRRSPEVCVSFVANGIRFPLETAGVLDRFGAPVPPPGAWRRRVTCQSVGTGSRSESCGNGLRRR
jgi:hypothetical protein